MPHPVQNNHGQWFCSNYSNSSQCQKTYSSANKVQSHINARHSAPLMSRVSHSLFGGAGSSSVAPARPPSPTYFTGSVSARMDYNQMTGKFDTTLSAIQDGAVVGTLKMAVENRGTTATIDTVANHARNRYKGIGSSLIAEATQLAQSYGATKLETVSTAQEAQAFYQKLGFRPNPELYSQMAHAIMNDPHASHYHKTPQAIAARVPVWEKPI